MKSKCAQLWYLPANVYPGFLRSDDRKRSGAAERRLRLRSVLRQRLRPPRLLPRPRRQSSFTRGSSWYQRRPHPVRPAQSTAFPLTFTSNEVCSINSFRSSIERNQNKIIFQESYFFIYPISSYSTCAPSNSQHFCPTSSCTTLPCFLASYSWNLCIAICVSPTELPTGNQFWMLWRSTGICVLLAYAVTSSWRSAKVSSEVEGSLRYLKKWWSFSKVQSFAITIEKQAVLQANLLKQAKRTMDLYFLCKEGCHKHEGPEIWE